MSFLGESTLLATSMMTTRSRDAILTSVAAALLVTVFFFSRRSSKRTKGQEPDPRLPPVVTRYPAAEFFSRAFRNQGPSFLLQTARELCIGDDDHEDDPDNSQQRTVPAFQFPELRLLPFVPPPFRFFAVTDHRLARTILESPQSSKPKPFYKFFDECLGGDCFMSENGHRGVHARRAVAAAFKPQSVRRMTEGIDALVEDWIRKHDFPQSPSSPSSTGAEQESSSSSVELDIAAEMMDLTTDIIGKIGFDYTMSVTERAEFQEDLQIALHAHYFKTNPLKIFPSTMRMFQDIRTAFRATDRMLEVAYRMLEHYRSHADKDDPEAPIHSTILAMIANNDEYENDRQRATDILLFFFAGFDTTASALGWTFLELARHPQELENLRKSLSECKSMDEQINCPAVKHVSREILRMYAPAALGSIRQNTKDLPVPGTEQVIPAGSVCILPYYVIMRDGSVFDKPDAFRPSRWANASSEQLKAFLPFAAGRRNCGGMALAQAEMSIIISKLVSRFHFDVVQEGRPEFFVTLKVDGLKLRLAPLQTQ